MTPTAGTFPLEAPTAATTVVTVVRFGTAGIVPLQRWRPVVYPIVFALYAVVYAFAT